MWGKSTGSPAEDQMTGAFEGCVVIVCIGICIVAAAAYGLFRLVVHLIK
jgi:hypothetical protein